MQSGPRILLHIDRQLLRQEPLTALLEGHESFQDSKKFGKSKLSYRFQPSCHPPAQLWFSEKAVEHLVVIDNLKGKHFKIISKLLEKLKQCKTLPVISNVVLLEKDMFSEKPLSLDPFRSHLIGLMSLCLRLNIARILDEH